MRLKECVRFPKVWFAQQSTWVVPASKKLPLDGEPWFLSSLFIIRVTFFLLFGFSKGGPKINFRDLGTSVVHIFGAAHGHLVIHSCPACGAGRDGLCREPIRVAILLARRQLVDLSTKKELKS